MDDIKSRKFPVLVPRAGKRRASNRKRTNGGEQPVAPFREQLDSRNSRRTVAIPAQDREMPTSGNRGRPAPVTVYRSVTLPTYPDRVLSRAARLTGVDASASLAKEDRVRRVCHQGGKCTTPSIAAAHSGTEAADGQQGGWGEGQGQGHAKEHKFKIATKRSATSLLNYNSDTSNLVERRFRTLISAH